MRKECTERLKERQIHPLMKKLYTAKNINYKLQISKKNKSAAITMEELENVLKTSKTGKSCDLEGMVRKLFSLKSLELILRSACYIC